MKLEGLKKSPNPIVSLPTRGARIETRMRFQDRFQDRVAPHTGGAD